MAEVAALSPKEEGAVTQQILPLLRTWLPEPLIPKAHAAIRKAIGMAKAKWKAEFQGFYPAPGAIGCQVIAPKDFNITTFRKEYTATGWQDSPIANFTTSENTYIVIVGHQDPEFVIRLGDYQWEIGGEKQPVHHLEDMRKDAKHFQGCESFILGPKQTVDLDVNVVTTGYSEFKPIGLVIAPQFYLVSRTFIA